MFNKFEKVFDERMDGPLSIICILLFSLLSLTLVLKTKNTQYFSNQTLNALIYTTISLFTLALFSLLIQKTVLLSNLTPFLSAKELDSLRKEKPNKKELYKNKSIIDKHLVSFENWIEFFFFSILVLPIYVSPPWSFKKPFALLPRAIKNELSKNKKRMKIQLWAFKKNKETFYSIRTNI